MNHRDTEKTQSHPHRKHEDRKTRRHHKATNQLLAGLALLTVSLYLLERKRPALPYLVPMVFMMVTTLVAMSIKLVSFAKTGNLTLLVIGGAISLIAVWLVVEVVLAVVRYSRTPAEANLDIVLPDG